MTREIKYTLLVDNHACEGLEAEHGFAAWIDTCNESILFDTGAGKALQPNAERLGIELSAAQALILSHGHYDHTGGLADFLALNTNAHLYVGQAVALPRYSCHPGMPPRAIGMCSHDYHGLRDLPLARVHELHTPCELAPGIGITGPIPRTCPFEDTGGPFFLDREKRQADSIGDDQALWFETTDGLVIAVGCCHAGLINTVEYVRKITGINRVHGVVGGLHLLHAPNERLQKTQEKLSEWALDFLIPCHCTGIDSTETLRNVLGNNVVQPAHAGMVISLGYLQ